MPVLRETKSLAACFCSLLVLLGFNGARADWPCETKLTNGAGEAGDRFGVDVAISGDRMIVGARNERCPNGSNITGCGAAYIFHRQGAAWVLEARLSEPTGYGYGISFADDVALNGDLAVVSTTDPDFMYDGSAVHVFRRVGANWLYETTFDFPRPGREGITDFSLATDGVRIAIGARSAVVSPVTEEECGPWQNCDTESIPDNCPYITDQGPNGEGLLHDDDSDHVLDVCEQVGAVHVYRKMGEIWEEEARLIPPRDDYIIDRGAYREGLGNYHFGQDIAIQEDTLIIGINQASDIRRQHRGAVYVFQLQAGAWTQVAKKLPAAAYDFLRFGNTVSLSGDAFVAGSWPTDLNCAMSPGCGRAHVFRRTGSATWVEEAELTPAGIADKASYARDVALEGDLAVIGGAVYKPTAQSVPEFITYVFRRSGSTWFEEAQLTAQDVGGIDEINLGTHFGETVSLSGERIAIGARLETHDGLEYVGAAYIYEAREADCDGDMVMEACDEGFDCNTNSITDICDLYLTTSADCNGNGVPDECEEDCNSNLVPDSCDLASGTSQDCDANGVPDECDTDCNSSGAPDPCDVSGGASADCNGNMLPDECESLADCNLNGQQDICDLAAGVPDCNGNGRPDPCDLADGTSLDCNVTFVPDECEFWLDCNRNYRPDECDIQDGLLPDDNANGVSDECECSAPTIYLRPASASGTHASTATRFSFLAEANALYSMYLSAVGTRITMERRNLRNMLSVPPLPWTRLG